MFKRNFFFPKKKNQPQNTSISFEFQMNLKLTKLSTYIPLLKQIQVCFLSKETYFWRWMVPRSRRLEQTEVCLQLRVWGHQSTVRQFLLVLAPLVLLISHPKRNIYQSHVAMKYLYSTLLNEFCQFGNSWDKHYEKNIPV